MSGQLCTLCGSFMHRHCASRNCNWWRCPRAACSAFGPAGRIVTARFEDYQALTRFLDAVTARFRAGEETIE